VTTILRDGGAQNAGRSHNNGTVPEGPAAAVSELSSLLAKLRSCVPACNIGVVGTKPRVGSTTVVANLALEAALQGDAVLLVNCAKSESSLLRFLGLEENCLEESMDNEVQDLLDCLIETRFENLTYVDWRQVTRNRRRAMSQTKEFKDCLSAKFDVILWDLPPVGFSRLGTYLAAQLAGVLLVVEANTDGIADIRKGRISLERAEITVLGAVLNKCD